VARVRDHHRCTVPVTPLCWTMASGIAESSAMPVPSLVVWDFDWSMINENSDVFCFQSAMAEPEALLARIASHRAEMSWLDIMNDAHAFAGETAGVCGHELVEAVAAVPVFREVLQVIRDVQDAGHDQIVVSDANDAFISSFLSRHGLEKAFSTIHTNRAELRSVPAASPLSSARSCCSRCKEAGTLARLHVLPHDDPPSACELCPPRLCKGEVLDRFTKGRVYSSVLYVGDGSGDLCPCLRLGASDSILARAGFVLAKKLQTMEHRACVREWEDGAALAGLLRRALGMGEA
jgi:pyridoxal phosphate phosphatase PHOSPHO2